LLVLSLARCWANVAAAVTQAVGSVGSTRERKEVESVSGIHPGKLVLHLALRVCLSSTLERDTR